MKGFIEVTTGKLKTLLAVTEIKGVNETKKRSAMIFLKEYYRPLFSGIDGEFIFCKETFEEVKARIAKAVAE